MKSRARRIARAFASHRGKLIALAVMLTAFLMVVYVPIVPYSPSCLDRHAVGPVFLAPEFRRKFTARLRSWDVPYIALDGLVLVRFWDEFSDPGDHLINASNKAFYALVDPSWGADFASLPPHVVDLIPPYRRDGDVNPTCELVRAVAIEGW